MFWSAADILFETELRSNVWCRIDGHQPELVMTVLTCHEKFALVGCETTQQTLRASNQD